MSHCTADCPAVQNSFSATYDKTNTIAHRDTAYLPYSCAIEATKQITVLTAVITAF